MAEPALSTADRFERLAEQLHSLAFDFREPSQSLQRAERMIADAERIAGEVRAAVRGPLKA